MAKEVKAKVKLQLQGGAATPAPPVGSSLGPHQVNIMEFCKLFNAQTANKKGETVPVEITVFKDKTFVFITKTPPVSELIKKKAKITKGSSRPQEIIGRITKQDVEDIAKIKLSDTNAHDLERAKKSVVGSARSMGIEVID
ncbi:MAG TPA: 50S ribosomal protein L11 [Candidatus Babeliales bacterium]|nr:50S ribosomal protein L11 [Candidatus Babeliales bacterium]